jgi:osmotically-inducible protein OsmY
MTQPAALLILPAREHTGEETDAARRAALLLQQTQADLCLAERIERALRATGYGPLRGIAVTVHARLVLLGGRVPSYYLKQVAQATALAVPGARQVRNDLDVGRPKPCRNFGPGSAGRPATMPGRALSLERWSTASRRWQTREQERLY